MPPAPCRLWLLPLLVTAGGCVVSQHDASYPPPACDPPPPLVIVANGGGDFRCTSKALIAVVEEDGLPLQIEPFLWSHGHYRVIADQIDHKHAACQAQRLAGRILEQREACPDGRLCLLGHCAGCIICLKAAELLPPGAVDRMILMGPSACCKYDLRPALRCPTEGIDVFYSKKDWFSLGVGALFGKLLNGKCHPCAGRFGFRCPVDSPDDAELYARLRQYPWQESQECTGHTGGHFGYYEPGFLRAFILPLMLPTAEPAP